MGIWNLPARNVVDVAAAGISLTPERLSSDAYWSRPYRKVQRSALILKEASHTGYENFKRFSVVGESVAHSQHRGGSGVIASWGNGCRGNWKRQRKASGIGR